MIDETHLGFMAHRQQYGITTKEAQVLLLLLDLKYIREVACRLGMREDKVVLHVKSLARKHEVSTSGQVILGVRELLGW